VNDDLALSLYLDGRLPAEERAAFERRLDAEPALRGRIEALRRLQDLSAGLARAEAAFSADDVRVRAELRPRAGRWRLGVAAAAALALAATHAGTYAYGAKRGAEAERAERTHLEETEALLARAAALDVVAPDELLESELATLREEIPARLLALSRVEEPRAARCVEVLRQMDVAFEDQRDPRFLGLRVKLIAGGRQLTLVPATATDYCRVAPAGEGRYRVIFIENVNETPRTLVDEGTPEELEARYPVRFAGERR
jgi:hypothetical protein